MKPLFMWAGGKSKMLKHYSPLMPYGNVSTYSEPFFGGGAMMIEVMKRYSPQRIFINDINGGIIGIYRCIKDECSEFERILDGYSAAYLPLSKPDRKRFFYDLREENAWQHSKWTFVHEHAVLYFLMKTAFNGIWQINKNTNGRFGTPSGLLNQTNEVYSKTNVREWSHAMNSCECILSCDDWSAVPLGDFTFYDPPYRDSFADYNESFPDKELEKIIATVEQTHGVWLCNRDAGDGFFDNRNARVFRFPVTYTAGRRKRTESGFAAKQATEILLMK